MPPAPESLLTFTGYPVTMERIRLALLMTSYERYHTRRNYRRELDADLVEYEVTDGDLPEGFEFDGFVVTGSAASVYWDEGWIARAGAWATEALERGIPALGICFGHQFLADVLGGTVEDMGEYELGYRSVRRAGESTLLSGLPEEFVVFETHSDRVVELPPGARLTAENEYGVQGFETDLAYAVQFHPEYDTETAREVTRGKETVTEQRKRRVLDGIDEETYREACEAKVLFDNFTGLVRERRERVEGTSAG